MSDRLDEAFKAMADANRRRIMAALCRQPHEAGELGRLVGLAPNAVSFHLRALKAADLVHVQREGRRLRYSVAEKGMASWLGQVRQLFPSVAMPELHAEMHTIAEPYPTAETIESRESDQLPTELL